MAQLARADQLADGTLSAPQHLSYLWNGKDWATVLHVFIYSRSIISRVALVFHRFVVYVLIVPRWKEDAGLARALRSNSEPIRLLAEYALAHAWNASQLAERLGRDRSSLSRFLRDRKPREETIAQYIELLGLKATVTNAIRLNEYYRDSADAVRRFEDALEKVKLNTRNLVLLRAAIEELSRSRPWPADSKALKALFDLTNMPVPLADSEIDATPLELQDVLCRINISAEAYYKVLETVFHDVGPVRADKMKKLLERSPFSAANAYMIQSTNLGDEK